VGNAVIIYEYCTEMEQTTKHNKGIKGGDVKEWFEEVIHTLKSDQLMLEHDVASEKTKKFYGDLIDENYEALLNTTWAGLAKITVHEMLVKYLMELKNRAVSFKELAFDLTGGKVLVWAVVSDNDDTSEKNLILSEAKVNAHFTDSIFRLSSTIVEEGDQLPIPNQYLLFSKA
jgi:hypothetical protein